MTKIKNLVYHIDEELDGAKEYAESYIEAKAKGNQNRASIYKAMAQDELNHSMNLHKIAIEDIDELERVYQPSEEMQEKWDKAHKRYVEKSALIKQMLAM